MSKYVQSTRAPSAECVNSKIPSQTMEFMLWNVPRVYDVKIHSILF